MATFRLRCCALALCLAGLSLPSTAQAWFVSIDGSVSPLSNPIAGRVKLGAGASKGHWHFEGAISFIPADTFILYKNDSGGVTEMTEAYPVFLGAGVRYYIRSSKSFEKRNDMYVGGGADFPFVEESFLPGFKISGGYALRLHRKLAMEMGLDYYFFGALTNELFIGVAFKGVF